jgi:PLP dependent protein
VSRTDELAANLRGVRERIVRACDAAARDPVGVTLLAVTKTWPVDDVRALAELGIADFGENRQQELAEKADATSDLALRWHFVGQLQTNKARAVAAVAAVVHSLDRARLIEPLAVGAAAAGRRLDVLVQVSLDDSAHEPARGGAAPAEVGALCEAVTGFPSLRLAGFMAVPPLGADPLSSYRTLAHVAADMRATYPTATVLSAGMSSDLDAAIRTGSTLVRVGTALLGGRPPIVG